MEMIAARWFTKGEPDRKKQLIVLHSMEAPDKPDMAEQVGKFFQNLAPDRKASAHVGVDCNSSVRYVDDDDVAYAAPGANHNGLHIEQTGYARYARGEWTQPDMMLMLQQAASQLQKWHKQYGVPLRYISAAALQKCDPYALPEECYGVTTHWDITEAWHKSTHTDPGNGYPINTVLSMALAGAVTKEEANVIPYIPVHRSQQQPGYWLVKPSDGGVFSYEGAPFYGSLAGKALQAPIVAASSTPSGNGYWLLGADGGVFCFGDAQFTDSYAGHPEWQQGSRIFVDIQPHGNGYDLISVELNSGVPSDPPAIDKYDLSERR